VERYLFFERRRGRFRSVAARFMPALAAHWTDFAEIAAGPDLALAIT
jgi:hypothetical protein